MFEPSIVHKNRKEKLKKIVILSDFWLLQMKCNMSLLELDGCIPPVAPIPLNCSGTESNRKISLYWKYLIGRERFFKSLQELTFSTLDKVLKK